MLIASGELGRRWVGLLYSIPQQFILGTEENHETPSMAWWKQ
jgi:hypothetical protein